MTITAFLSDRLRRLLFQAVSVLAAAVFLSATGTQTDILVLLLIIWAFLLAGIQIYDYFKCRAHLLELESVMDNLDEKYLFTECIPSPRSLYERRLFALVRRAGRSMLQTVSDAQTARQEYREYVESFVHEIKAPITAAKLICRHVEPETGRKLTKELSQIEAHVERALFYARLESPEKDFLIRQTSPARISADAVERHRSLLIQNGFRIETKDLDQTVYTDEKWAAFIFGQLLQNAARYRSESPLIAISAKQDGARVIVTVSDNGIGIPAHELPRVFDRGFTGSNGRCRGGSTGMGLYLCRRLADRMETELQISSEEGKGTLVTLIFPARSPHPA